MLAEITFWLILLASWFAYIAPSGPLKRIWLLLSPLLLLAIGTAGIDAAKVFAGIILSLSHGRYFMGRYGEKRVKRILKRSWTLLLMILSLIYLLEWLLALNALWTLSAASLLWLVLSLKAITSTVSRSIRNRYSQRMEAKDSIKDLPTVTLAIPARNETHVLTDCLRSAIASDYPKLEIIVLDDCSQDSTPQIIKSFAHDGVRFVSGKAPARGWIGKNQAYQTLLKEASGEIVVFAGVDVRWQPDSMAKIAELFSDKHRKMISIMPYRSHFDLLPSATRTLRYFWQLAFARLPVMNSAWAARRDWLNSAGGIEPFKHAILPETKLAYAADQEDAYSFILSNPSLGVSSRKHASSQFETAIRTLYPQSAKDPLLAVIWAAFWLALAGLVAASWFTGIPVLIAGSAAFVLSYFICEMDLQPKGWMLSGALLPLALATQGVLSVASMSGYEFGRIDWKGRNICLPVMRQTARGGVFPAKSQRSV